MQCKIKRIKVTMIFIVLLLKNLPHLQIRVEYKTLLEIGTTTELKFN